MEGFLRLILFIVAKTVPTVKQTQATVRAGHAIPPMKRLYNDLFSEYRKEVRPIHSHAKAVNVTVQLWFRQLLKVNEIDQILTLYCWVEEYWRDEHLRWNPTQYSGITILRVPATNIWRPDILVYNNADMNIQENELTTNVVLHSSGDVECFRATIFTVPCSMDMTYFPFDQQKCAIKLASWSFDGSMVFIAPKTDMGNLDYYVENTQWKLINFTYQQNVQYYSCCPEPYIDITYNFELERNPSYYTQSLIITSVLIIIVTMVGFYTPYSSTGENTEKASLGVTALRLLAIILLMVAEKMPATNVFPFIGKYYIGLCFWIYLAALVSSCTLQIQSKGNVGKPLKARWRSFFFNVVARAVFMPVEKLSTVKVQHVASNTKNINEDEHIALTSSFPAPSTSEKIQNVNAISKWDQSENEDVDRCHQQAIRNRQELVLQLRIMHRVIRKIGQKWFKNCKQAKIRTDWELVARLCERVLMYAFIVGTLLFAILMLYSPGRMRLMTWQ